MVELTGSSSPFQQSISNLVFYVPAAIVFGLAGKSFYLCNVFCLIIIIYVFLFYDLYYVIFLVVIFFDDVDQIRKKAFLCSVN